LSKLRRAALTVLATLCSVVGSLLFTGATASAALPEAPKTEPVTAITAATAMFHGVLNPNAKAPGEAGHYEFLYRASKAECKGGSKAPEPSGTALGFEHEQVPAQEVTGLTPHTEYTVCLLARNLKGEEAVGSAVTFRTALPPETPETLPASEITGTTATLNGVLNPKAEGEPGTYELRYRASATECEGTGERKAPVPAGAAVGHEKEPISVPVSGLSPTRTYTFCLRAENGAGEHAVGPPETFTTLAAAPTVSALTISGITQTAATLSAQIAPGGAPTRYQVEYEPGKRTPEQDLAASATPVGVQQTLTGLTPGTEYRARFLASNSAGAGEDAPTAFLTQPSSGGSALGLPDNRGYELVSTIANTEVDPPNQGQPVSFEMELGELVGSNSSYRAAVGGGAVSYVGGAPSSGVGGAGVSKNGFGTHYLAVRTAEGWQASAIEPASQDVLMKEFSADLSLQIFSVSIASNRTRAHSEFGAPSACEEGEVIDSRAGGVGVPVYHALVSAEIAPPLCERAEPAGISADNSHVLFQSPEAYTSQATNGGEGKRNLYDSVGGVPHQVNILPDGKPEASPDATFGGFTEEDSEANPVAAKTPFNFAGDVSADGSRVFWTSLEVAKIVFGEPVYRVKALYMRENDAQPQSRVEGGRCTEPAKACTVLVSTGGKYWSATADGRYVLYTEGGGLWRFDTSTGTHEALAGEGLGGESAGVHGVIGSSDDGSYVYFVAGGRLADNANDHGEKAQPQTCEPGGESGFAKGGTSCNLYVRHDGTTVFIAKLSSPASDDNQFTGSTTAPEPRSRAGDWRANPGWRTAEVAPDGHAVAFMSRVPLTGYDNKRPGFLGLSEETEGLPEVFVYEAGGGRLSCASCNPAGAPPVATAERWETERGGYAAISTSPVFATHWISDAHGVQVYFNTSQPLVARDTNHRQDVYEWESNGTGGCTRQSGCVSLLSGGDGPYDAYFVDASVSGEDAFFTSREQLLPRALGETPKLYDVRTNGGFPETSLACTGTGCQGAPPAPPGFATPASATFNGTGNFPAQPVVNPKPKPKPKCKRGFTRKHNRCIKLKRKGAKRTARKARNHRRASR
jgi:hypothetical protein